MYTIQNSQTSTPIIIPWHNAHPFDLFRKDHLQSLQESTQQKKNKNEHGCNKNKIGSQQPQRQIINKRKNVYQKNEKNYKINSHRNNAEMIDRILIKNALLNLKYPHSQPTVNTSIEQNNYFLTSSQNAKKKQTHIKGYTPQITQNEQQHKQNFTRSRNSKQKVDISKIRSSNYKNDSLFHTKSSSHKHFTKLRYDQLKLKSENLTPSDNQWENSMNMIRLEKRQNEKTKKYCRIMIRKINTDQLLTKRKGSQAKLKSNKIYNYKAIKAIKPIINPISQSDCAKTPQLLLPMENNLLFQTQNILLNPWSTTEIKLRQDAQMIHQD